MAAFAPRGIICQLRPKKRPVPPPLARRIVARDSSSPAPNPPSQAPDQAKIVLQPRMCTLRSYGSDRGGVIRTKIGDGSRPDELSPFLANLFEYVESTKRSQDFETISGRFAMVVFAATLGIEFTTGNSIFRKMDLQGIEEAAGICVAAVACAALFAWFTSNRTRVGRIFTTSCNTFIDSLIDNIIDGLFYGSDPSDWTDDI
ncbi:hypothetical protein V2J09_009805 [Rumex salicifolius]